MPRLLTPAVAEKGYQEALSRVIDSSGHYSPPQLLLQVDPAFAEAHSCWFAVGDPRPRDRGRRTRGLHGHPARVEREERGFPRLPRNAGGCAAHDPHPSGRVGGQGQVMAGRPAKDARDDAAVRGGCAFIDVFAFVVDMGGFSSAFLRDLMSFHSKFVNPHLRRLRLDVFRAVANLPMETPHLQTAALK